MIYLDWAATAPPDREVHRIVFDAALDSFGNPSSLHLEGVRASDRLVQCRRMVAKSLGCLEEEVLFTSGGTESNNLVLTSLLSYVQPGHAQPPTVVTSAVEHPSVHDSALSLHRWGVGCVMVKPPSSGILDAASIGEALDDNTRMVSLQLVNNETGALQPVAEAAKIIRNFSEKRGRRILIHTDAVQAFGKVPLRLAELDVDAASISGHKLGAPKGTGALYLRSGCSFAPLYRGGEQERGYRPGTENLPGICGLALCAEKAVSRLHANFERASQLMTALIDELSCLPDAIVLPESPESRHRDRRLVYSPYILKVAFPPVPADVLVRVLSERGICISTGSACSSKKRDRIRVLTAMGVSREIAGSSVRVSLGASTGEEQVAGFINALKEELPELLRISRRSR